MTPTRPPSGARMRFVYVKLPVIEGLDDPFHEREDRIDNGLRAQGLGTVLGWGDSLGEVMPSGARRVAFTRVDLEVTDVDAARSALRLLLADMAAPVGTEIHYDLGEARGVDVYAPPGWVTESRKT